MATLDYEPPPKRGARRNPLFEPLSPLLLVFIMVAAAVAVGWWLYVD